MGKAASNLRWGVEQRLEFIEFRLFWEGGINRSDLISHFGVSVPQASNDLSQYQELAPENIAYNKNKKRYEPTDSFRPRFLEPDADRYLAQLQSITNHAISLKDTWLAQAPAFEAVPMPHRNVDPDVVRTVVNAIRKRNSIGFAISHSLSIARNRPGAGFLLTHWHSMANGGMPGLFVISNATLQISCFHGF